MGTLDMKSWRDLSVAQQQLVIGVPTLVGLMLVTAKVYQEVHNACEDDDNDVSYFQSLGYLQTVAFTIGYGHISPTCHTGKIFSFFFAYISIPLVVYILAIAGRLIVEAILEVEDTRLKGLLSHRSPIRNICRALLLDLFIITIFILVPAGIVKGLEPCFTYGDSLWYMWQTITT